MNYFIFKEQIFTVYLSLSHLTAITYPDRVHDYVGGTEGDFKIYELNKKRSLVFEPKRKDIDRNFIVFNQKGKYHFNIKYDEKLSNKDIEVQNATKCNLYTLLKSTDSYQLFECPKSILFVNKLKNAQLVNTLQIANKKYLSKGPPIYLNGKMIYYKGELL